MIDVAHIEKSRLVGHIDYHESLASTNDRALELASREDVDLPCLVVTERQTAGRGRGVNQWWSAEGALTFSLLLETTPESLPMKERSRAALVAGLAVCEALQPLVPRVDFRVKWPNDVLAGGAKICGVLCESAPGSNDRLVVGIGINVNNSLKKTPVPFSAVALVDLDGLDRDLTEVLLAVLDQVDRRWSELHSGRFADLAGAYRERCLLTGRTLTVTSGNEQFVGVCRGIDEHGALVLATEGGPRTIIAGSVDSWT